MTSQQVKGMAIVIGIAILFYYTTKIYRFFRFRHARKFFLENGFTTTEKKAVYKTVQQGDKSHRVLSGHKDEVVFPKIKIRNQNIVVSKFNSAVLPENISLKSANNMLGSLVGYKPIVDIRYTKQNQITFFTKEKRLEAANAIYRRKSDEIVLAGDLLTGEIELLNHTKDEHSLFLSGIPNSGKSYSANSILDQVLTNGFTVYVISSKAKIDFKDPRIQKRIVPSVDDQNQELLAFIDEQSVFFKEKKRLVEESQFTNLKHLETEKRVFLFDEMWLLTKLEKNAQAKILNFIEFLIREARYLNTIIILASQSPRSNEIPVPFKMCSVLMSGRLDTGESSEAVFGSKIAFETPLKSGELILKRAGHEPKLVRVFAKVE